jgi:hypothetical protein
MGGKMNSGQWVLADMFCALFLGKRIGCSRAANALVCTPGRCFPRGRFQISKHLCSPHLTEAEPSKQNTRT